MHLGYDKWKAQCVWKAIRSTLFTVRRIAASQIQLDSFLEGEQSPVVPLNSSAPMLLPRLGYFKVCELPEVTAALLLLEAFPLLFRLISYLRGCEISTSHLSFTTTRPRRFVGGSIPGVMYAHSPHSQPPRVEREREWACQCAKFVLACMRP